MRQAYSGIQELGADVLVVTFSAPERIPEYQREHGWPFTVVADPDRSAYVAFGLERAPWRRLVSPRMVGRYLALMVAGRRLGRDVRLRAATKGDDMQQLGGDFVLDREGRIVFAHRSRDPADRPSVAALTEAIVAAAGAEPETDWDRDK